MRERESKVIISFDIYKYSSILYILTIYPFLELSRSLIR